MQLASSVLNTKWQWCHNAIKYVELPINANTHHQIEFKNAVNLYI